MADVDTGLHAALSKHIGTTSSPMVAKDPVNEPMIGQWCDALGDANPTYTSAGQAATGRHGRIVAPPSMLNAWTKVHTSPDGNNPRIALGEMLDAAGYVGVVATNAEHTYRRYLRSGDVITAAETLTAVSEEKQTELGVGYFLTSETVFTDDGGDVVGELLYRIFKFKPGTGRNRGADDTPKPNRPRPAYNSDSAWFWEGCRERELRVQVFADGTTAWPPLVRNPKTGEMPDAPAWQVASGRATLYSFAVPHHPPIPSFDYPLCVGLVELEEGVRLVSNIVGCTPAQLTVGMALEVCWLQTDEDTVIHQFRPAPPPRRTTTLGLDQVAVGDPLPLFCIPITSTLIVGGAMASRDLRDVHHDPELARQKGAKDIYMNILTSTGLSNRYLNDWAGPDATLRSLKIELGAPNYPGDAMTLSGTVTKTEELDGEGVVTVEFTGVNQLGTHLDGSAELTVPRTTVKG